ncbi:MAG: type I 3-dehydroquinate dehydratase [Clostridia bacterium]|nr:type I 3-dehydroquinate dehydratase [Clostridia bacterium]
MMRKPTFLTYEKPLLTCMVQAETPDRIKELVARSEGAEAFGMQFCKMKPEYRTKETYRELFSLAAPLPTYVTNYRYGYNEGKSDEELAEGILELAECGATLCDVMGDLFDKQDDELARDEGAIQKQMKLIDELHARGAEVLMSSHVFKFTPAERVLEIALEQKRRGADIAKIVTKSTSMEEQIENMRIVHLLKQELGIPFLFLANGDSHILRRVGGILGNCTTLCVVEYDELATKTQPLLSEMKQIRDLM